MKSTELPETIFNKNIEAEPRHPIRKLSKNWYVDANLIAYEMFEINGEKIFKIKFPLLKF